MTKVNISTDSLVILLLCSNLAIPKGMESEFKPLTLTEWNTLAKKVIASSLKRPEAFLLYEADKWQKELGLDSHQYERLAKLLSRQGSLAIELKRLSDMGVWVLTRSELTYPCRLKKILKDKAPVVIYGSGDMGLFDICGVGIVGSRDADESGISFTKQLARACVRDGFNIVSGGARGVDLAAQETALAEGGQVISVLTNGLASAMRNKTNREAVMKKQLLLMSPYHPQARFNIGAAMGRNKLIYALSNFTVVISASKGKGGTWSGAVENIKHNWVPLFVRDADDIPDGNRALINQGVNSLSVDIINEKYGLSNILSTIEKEAKSSIAIVNNDKSIQDQEKSKTPQGSIAEGESTEYSRVNDLYEVIWPYIKNTLASVNEGNSKTLAGILNVNDQQMKDWLQRATDEGRIEKLSRPVRYRLSSSQQPLLFELDDKKI